MTAPFKKLNTRLLAKILIILHIYTFLQMLFVFLITSYEGSISTFIYAIDIIIDKLDDLINLDPLIGMLIVYMSLIFRVHNYIASFVLISKKDLNEESYGVKHKILMVIGLLALPIWMWLIFYTSSVFCYVFTENSDNIIIKYIVLFVFSLIPLIIIAVSTIIMDIMGLCYKSQEK